MATRALQVVISGDSSRFDKSLKNIDKSVDRSEGRMRKFGKVAGAALSGVGIAAAAGAAVGIKKAAEAAIEAEKSQARMVAQLKAAGISYKAHAAQIDEVIQKHSKLSGLDDEDLADSFTNIVRVTGNVNSALRLNGLAADFSRAKNIDVAKAGELVGKVAGGNTGILSRYGIKVKEGATAQEALGVLQEKFAGQAAAYGKTTQGSLDRASVAGENLGEVVGSKLTPLLAKAADALVNLVDKSGSLAGPIRTVKGVVRNAYDGMVNAVRNFAHNNRKEIREVVEAYKRVSRWARDVFVGVVIPVVKRIAPVMRTMAESVTTIVGRMVTATARLINGDWRAAWKDFKDIPRAAARSFRSLDGLIEDAMKASLRTAARLAKRIGIAIVAGIVDGMRGKVGGSGIKRTLEAILGSAAKPFLGIGGGGDGLGRGIGQRIGSSMGVPGLGGGSLKGADPDLGPFAGIGQRFSLGVSSGLRPGAITSSGNPSFHGTGDAIDLTGSPGGMLGYFRHLKRRFGSRLRELIYTPGGVGVKDGQPYRYTGQVAADHKDHVHVAYTGPFGDGIGKIARTARNRLARGDGNGVSRARLKTIIAAAKRAGISPSILYGLFGAESNFGRNLGPSSAGARGPFQFMPSTAASMGVNPMNFKSAAFGAARYLGQYKSRGTRGMLAAYNAGPAGNPNNPETQAYIPKVLALAKQFGGPKGLEGVAKSGGKAGIAIGKLDTAVKGLGAGALSAKGLKKFKAFHEVMDAIRVKVKDAATQAASAFRQIREGEIANSPLARELAALRGEDDRIAAAATAQQLQDQLTEANKAVEDARKQAAQDGSAKYKAEWAAALADAEKQQKDAVAAIAANNRAIHMQSLQDQLDAQNAGLDAEEANFAASMQARLGVLVTALGQQKITYAQYAQEVNKILAAYGLAVEMTPDESKAIGGGPGKAPVKPFNPWVRARNRMGRRAHGGPVTAGEAYLVGERGPEMLQMGGRSGHVVPNHKLKGQGVRNVYLTQSGDVHIGSHRAARVMADRMAFRLAYG